MKVNIVNLNLIKYFIILVTTSFLITQQSFSESPEEIEGVLIPNKGFNSVIPFATMYLSKKQPPVIKITVAQPTLLLFPFQVSNCWGNNNALAISDANIVKDSTGKPTNFSQVILNVKGEAITDGSAPDQTAMICKSVDNNAYPLGVEFVEDNPYSIVKFLKKQENYALSLDQFGFEKGFSDKDNGSYFKKDKKNKNQKEEKPEAIQNKIIEKKMEIKEVSPNFVNKNVEKKNIPSSFKEKNSESIKSSLEKMGIYSDNKIQNDNVTKSDKENKMESLLKAAGIIAENKGKTNE